MFPFLVGLFTDKQRVDLPIFTYVIEHDEGVIVVDTGERADTATNFITQSSFTVRPDEQIDAQLQKMGIRPRDVSKVVLTHLHGDHVDGVGAFEGVEVFIGPDEYAAYKSRFGGLLIRRTTRLPRWFAPIALTPSAGPLGAFPISYPLTRAGDVVAVPTPGHTGGHISVIAVQAGIHYVMAGDVTYDEQALIDQKFQGPTVAVDSQRQSLRRMLDYARSQPTVYLPAHDWNSGKRLAQQQIVPALA